MNYIFVGVQVLSLFMNGIMHKRRSRAAFQNVSEHGSTSFHNLHIRIFPCCYRKILSRHESARNVCNMTAIPTRIFERSTTDTWTN